MEPAKESTTYSIRSLLLDKESMRPKVIFPDWGEYFHSMSELMDQDASKKN